MKTDPLAEELTEIEKVVMFQRGSFEAGVILKPTRQVMDMLHSMTVGSGGAQYLHKNIEERMGQLPDKYFMYIAQSNHVKGTFAAALRTIDEDFGKANAYYIRYFVFEEKMQATKDKPVKHGKSDGIFKGLAKKYLSQSPSNYGLGYGEDASLPSFYYAFFDAQNFRSTDLSQILGLNPVGDFDTFAFTRMHPSKSKSVSLLESVHYESMRKRVAEQYKDFSVYSDQFMYVKDNYYVLKEGGEVVVGAQVNKCEWEVKNMSGTAGWFLLNILPHTPILRNYFNPKKFDFITFDFIYIKPGYEHKLAELYESMLAEFNVNISLNWHDVKSPFHGIMERMDLGFLSNFTKVPTGKIMMTTNNLTPEQLKQITDKPMFTCGMDMT